MQEQFMREAIKIAKKVEKDIPVGAVIVKDNKIIAKAINNKEKTNDITGHAEINAIKKAAKKLCNWRLDECDLYVTLEPCPMCAWAIIQSRIRSVYFGSYDTQYGAFNSKINLCELVKNRINIKGGIFEDECDNLIYNFFNKVRNDK